MNEERPSAAVSAPPHDPSSDFERPRPRRAPALDALRALLERCPTPSFLLEGDRIVETNQAAERLFGLGRPELLGLTPYELAPATQPDGRSSADVALQALEAALSGRPQSFAYRLRSTSGEGLDTEVRLSLHPAADRDLVLAFVTDLTERHRLEADLRHSRKLEVVGQLYGGIAHDMGNLLTAIRGYVDLLSRARGDDPGLQDGFEKIRRCTERARTLLRRASGFRRGERTEMRPIQLNPIVDETALLLRSMFSPQIEFVLRTEPDIRPVLGDPGQIEQALMNLMLNARDAMPDGGTLTLSTSNRQIDDAFRATRPYVVPGPYVCLEVSDTGVGIRPEERDRIFDPFYSTKPAAHGTGLGLSIVYGVVKQHRGYIDFASTPGQGTTFWIWLPAAG